MRVSDGWAWFLCASSIGRFGKERKQTPFAKEFCGKGEIHYDYIFSRSEHLYICFKNLSGGIYLQRLEEDVGISTKFANFYRFYSLSTRNEYVDWSTVISGIIQESEALKNRLEVYEGVQIY